MGGKELHYILIFPNSLLSHVKAKVIISWKYVLMNWPVLERFCSNIPSYRTLVFIHVPLQNLCGPISWFCNIVQAQVGKVATWNWKFYKNARLHGIYVTVFGELPELHAKPVINEDLAVRQFKEEKMEKNGDRIHFSKGESFEYQRISKNKWGLITKIFEANEYVYKNVSIYNCIAKVKGIIFCYQIILFYSS